MKNSRRLLLLSLMLAVFFFLWTAAEFFFNQGENKIPEKSLKSLKLAMRIFPFQGEYPGEAGFALMEQGMLKNAPAPVKESIPYLKAALRRNPLDYRSRYYLSKAYLRLNSMENDYFDMGVLELRRAAAIRGSNKQVAVDCAKVFFSLWPLLEKEEQEFTVELLSGVMPTLSWNEFSPLVEMWSLYVQDAPLLMNLLQRKPELFGLAANQLASAAIPLAKRWEMLALHEANLLDNLERRYNEFNLQGLPGSDSLRPLLAQIRSIKGYHRLHSTAGFDAEKLNKLRRQFYLGVIRGMIGSSHEDPKELAQARELIGQYIAEHAGMGDLEDLRGLLEERGFFKENDFSSLRLKAMIAIKKSDFSGVIAEVEALRKGISFVKKEQAADYTDILLMLVDSYYSSKLMTAAEAVAAELLREQPDNPDILWRVLRVQEIMGIDGAPDPALQEKLAKVENSRFIAVAKQEKAFDIFLFNEPLVEITFDPALLASLKPQQLIQVFVDGKIANESYVEGLPEKVVIGAPFIGIESKAKVQIVIL